MESLITQRSRQERRHHRRSCHDYIRLISTHTFLFFSHDVHESKRRLEFSPVEPVDPDDGIAALVLRHEVEVLGQRNIARVVDVSSSEAGHADLNALERLGLFEVTLAGVSAADWKRTVSVSMKVIIATKAF